MQPETILKFWFEQTKPNQWWQKNADFDRKIKNQFLEIHQKAVQSELYLWRKTMDGRLAEIIVLDQFSRNIYRDNPLAFGNDSLALALAQEAVSLGLDKKLKSPFRSFLYLPFMHSESLAIHQVALELYQDYAKQEGAKDELEFEIKHKAIIERFNRYPHRNKILGRKSTPEEIEFLKEPNSSF